MGDLDWDAASENAYEQRRGRGDLCEICGDNLVVEADDFCRTCLIEVEMALAHIDFDAAVSGYDNREGK